MLLNPVKEREAANKSRLSFRSKMGDHLTMRNIFRQFTNLEVRLI